GAAAGFGPGSQCLGLRSKHVRPVAAQPDDAGRAAGDTAVGNPGALDVQKLWLGHASSSLKRLASTRLLAQAGRAGKCRSVMAGTVSAGRRYRPPISVSIKGVDSAVDTDDLFCTTCY